MIFYRLLVLHRTSVISHPSFSSGLVTSGFVVWPFQRVHLANIKDALNDTLRFWMGGRFILLFFVVVYFVALGKGLLLRLAVFWDSKMWGGEESKECGSGSWISILWSTMHILSSDLKDPCPMANGVVEERADLRSSLPCLWRILQDF